MKRLVVTGEALRDLRSIERFSRRTWGRRHAEAYQALLVEALARLMEKPSRGRRQDRIVEGMWRLNVRRHAIFYLLYNDDLVIARVLHQSMDINPGLFSAVRRQPE